MITWLFTQQHSIILNISYFNNWYTIVMREWGLSTSLSKKIYYQTRKHSNYHPYHIALIAGLELIRASNNDSNKTQILQLPHLYTHTKRDKNSWSGNYHKATVRIYRRETSNDSGWITSIGFQADIYVWKL